MKLTAKLLGVFLFANLLVTALYGYLAARREEQIFIERAYNQAQQFTETMEAVCKLHGTERVIQMLQMMPDDSEFHVRWVWFNAPPGNPYRPVVPSVAFGAAQLREIVSVPTRTEEGSPYVYSYWPLAVDALQTGGFEFSFPIAILDASRRKTLLDMLILMGAFTLTAGSMVILAGLTLVGEPLRKLTEKTRRVAEGELDQPLQLNTGDELSELATSLNEMCARLEASQHEIAAETKARIDAVEQLRHADRLRTVGRLASGIAHELGTPLNVIAGRAELIASGQLSPAQSQDSAAIIKKETERMTSIIRQLLDFARRQKPQRIAARLEPIVSQTLTLLSPLAGKNDISFRFDAETATCQAEVDVGSIQQVLTNLVMNAMQASSPGSTVEITLRDSDRPGAEPQMPGRFVCIAVTDYGHGISETDREQVFEPFYTTKDVGEGTGLGLSIAHRIVEEHGGWIEVESEVGRGSTFRVFLPCRP